MSYNMSNVFTFSNLVTVMLYKYDCSYLDEKLIHIKIVVFLNILIQMNSSFFADYNIISDGSFSHSTDVNPTNILVKLQILIFCRVYFDI